VPSAACAVGAPGEEPAPNTGGSVARGRLVADTGAPPGAWRRGGVDVSGGADYAFSEVGATILTAFNRPTNQRPAAEVTQPLLDNATPHTADHDKPQIKCQVIE